MGRKNRNHKQSQSGYYTKKKGNSNKESSQTQAQEAESGESTVRPEVENEIKSENQPEKKQQVTEAETETKKPEIKKPEAKKTETQKEKPPVQKKSEKETESETKVKEPEKEDVDEPAVSHEDSLELWAMSKKERRKAKLAKLKANMEDMRPLQKAGYIFSYYKWGILAALAALAICIFLPLTIYKNTRPVAISFVVVNAKDVDAINTDFVEDYIKTYNIKKPYRVISDLDVHLDKETYMEEYMKNTDSSDYTELPLKCYNGYFDIIIMDEKGLEYCAMQEITYPLKSYLPADIYKQVEARIVDAEGHEGLVVPFALDISDTSFAKGLNLGYSPVYLGFPGAKDSNYKNAKRMLNYILGIEVETE